MGLPLSSKVEFEAKARRSASPCLSRRRWPIHNLITNLPEFARSNLFIFILGLDRSGVDALCVFQDYLTGVAGSSESS